MVATSGETGRQDLPKCVHVIYRNNVMIARMSEKYLLGVGKALRLEREAWSKVTKLRQSTNKYDPSPLGIVGMRGSTVI